MFEVLVQHRHGLRAVHDGLPQGGLAAGINQRRGLLVVAEPFVGHWQIAIPPEAAQVGAELVVDGVARLLLRLEDVGLGGGHGGRVTLCGVAANPHWRFAWFRAAGGTVPPSVGTTQL